MNIRFVGLIMIYSIYAASMLTNPSSAYFTDTASSSQNTFTTAETFGEGEETPSANIFINEFLPNPSGPQSEDTEWIEIYNASNQIVDLSGWQLDDVEGSGSSIYVIPPLTTIEPNGYLIFEKVTTNVGLNNTGDDVRLLDESNNVIDTHTYTSTIEDSTIGRENDGLDPWKTCNVITKNSSNNGSC